MELLARLRRAAFHGRDAALRRAAASANGHSTGKYMRADGAGRRPYHGIPPANFQCPFGTTRSQNVLSPKQHDFTSERMDWLQPLLQHPSAHRRTALHRARRRAK